MLRRLDDAWYRIEKWLCVALLALMAVVVFLDAVHRQAANEGRLEAWCRKLFGEANAGPISTVIAALICWLVIYGALRTANVTKKPSAPLAAGLGLAGTALGYALVKGLVAAFPNGLIWAQSLGLAGMLWVGFLGASMATKEGNHLTLEIMEFIWRGKAKAHVGRVGAACAVVFCAVVGWLCLNQVLLERAEYLESDGAVGVMAGFEAPRWLVLTILPLSFGVMMLRFLGRVLGPTEEEKPPAIEPLKVEPGAAE